MYSVYVSSIMDEDGGVCTGHHKFRGRASIHAVLYTRMVTSLWDVTDSNLWRLRGPYF
jgi:hypothetical protein